MSDTQSTLTPWLHDGNKAPTHRAIILIFISIIVAYGNSLHCDWHYDDRFNIVNNPAIRMQRLDLKSIVKAVKEGHQQPGKVARPLAYATFALNYLFGGLDVFGYHAVNLCIHALAAVVLFFLIKNMLQLPSLRTQYASQAGSIALLATIYWALHPLNVTAVTYIVQRMASMAALFYLLALYCYLKGRLAPGNRSKIALFCACLLSGVGGIATKENAAMLPISILALDLYLFQTASARVPLWLKTTALTIICVIALYGIYKLTAGGLLDGYEKRPFTLMQRLLTQPRILIFYLGLFIYPTNSRLMLLHDPAVSTNLLTPWSTLPALLLVGAGIGFTIARRKRYPLASFTLLFFFLNHAIESTIIPLEMVYEHRNYLPTALLGILLAKGFLNLLVFFRHSKIVYPLLLLTGAFLVGANGYSTHLYNDVLRTNLGMWMDNARKAPGLSVVHNNLGNVLLAHGETERGIEAIREALRRDRFNNMLQKAVVYYNIGRAYERQYGIGHEKAQGAYRKALSISPTYPKALFNLAICKQNAGQFDEAEKLMNQAIESSLHHKDPSLLNGLSLVKLKQGDQAEAYRHATAVLLAAPDEIAPRAVLAEIHRRRGQYRKAIQYWEAALSLNANHLDGRLALTELYYQAGNMEKALCQIRHIAGLRPDSSFEMLVVDQKKRANLTAWTHDHALLEAAFKHYFRAGLEAMEQGS